MNLSVPVAIVIAGALVAGAVLIAGAPGNRGITLEPAGAYVYVVDHGAERIYRCLHAPGDVCVDMATRERISWADAASR